MCPDSQRVLQEEVTEKHVQRIQAELHRKRKELSELQQEVEPLSKEAELPVEATTAHRPDLQRAQPVQWSCDCRGHVSDVPSCLCPGVTCL